MRIKEIRQLMTRLRKSNAALRDEASVRDRTQGETLEAQWLACALISPTILSADPPPTACFRSKRHRDLYMTMLQLHAEGGSASDVPQLIDRLSPVGYHRQQTINLLHAIMHCDADEMESDRYAEILLQRLSNDDAADEENLGDGKIVRLDLNGGSPFQEFTTEQFLDEPEPRQWLIPNMLAQNEPAVLVGPSKSMKTSLAVDLCAALASGGKFLGQIAAARAFRVGFLSSTSERQLLVDLARRWNDANGVSSKQQPNWIWALTMSGLADAANLPHLRAWIAKHQLEVVMIDPRQWTAKRGGAQATQLRDLVQCCLDAGATPILCCGTQKTLGRRGIDTSHLASVGCESFAQQWMLVNRRRPFEPGSGQHHLWLTIGGNAGQSQRWGVDIDEGRLDDPTGRKWKVALHETESLRGEAVEQETRSQEQKLQAKIRLAITRLEPEQATKSKIRDQSGISGTKFSPTWDQMIAAGEIAKTSPAKEASQFAYPRYHLTDRSTPPEKMDPVRSNDPVRSDAPVRSKPAKVRSRREINQRRARAKRRER
ncbi:AAA family ATPase [Blastopirellula sp. J2-11]|uniref:AAA family ATPase n=1 Tax=Blastopirellula sp. J2-11 TaxID=2943192 RepID=UPI0021C909C1|nr:AAA family ATPase [Blastopirellula sp. J2-11]UUO05751.1 AAA family ATPase [Blastopirellula sp. J2-11]UUO08715.1 AAA family ATPase [Blastopirellula sp. J2-11]